MPIRLTIEITSPMDANDRELLSGIAVMTLAIANHEMARQAFPDTFPDDEPEGEPKPEEHVTGQARPCGAIDEASGMACISPVGHRGRHKFRPGASPSLVN